MSNILNAVLNGTPPVLKGYSIFTDAMEGMVRQRNALIRDDWNALERYANEGLGGAYGAYREMSRNVGVVRAQTVESRGSLASFLRSHAADAETRRDFFAELKSELLKARPDISDDWLKALDALGEGNVAHNVILESLKISPRGDEDMVNSAMEATVALSLRSLMALTYAGFESHYRRVEKYPFFLHRDEVIPAVSEEVESFGEALESRVEHLYDRITAGSSPQQACEELAALLETTLPGFGRMQASVRLYASSLKEQDNHTLAEKVARIGAKAGDLTRYAFAAYAAAYYLSLQSRAPEKDPKAGKVLEPDTDLRYDADFPDGKDVQLSKIDTAKEGDYIQVSGFVGSLEAARESDDKLISRVTLVNATGEASVDAAAVFVHLRHMGLQEGAYCSLSGTWRTASKINGGEPAVEIERLRINDLGEKSWKVRFQDLADRFVDRWPGGYNIQYCLSPHVSGGKEGKSTILGAGELIFKPFVR